MGRAIEQIRAVIRRLRGLSRSRVRKARTDSGTSPQALAVVGEGPCREGLQSVFSEAGWRLVVADNVGAAVFRQKQDPLPIILYDRQSTELDWRQAVAMFSRLSPRPCVILLSHGYDQNLWDELVRCGGFDVLRTPIDRNAVLQTVSAGWAIWRRKLAISLNQEITPLRTA